MQGECLHKERGKVIQILCMGSRADPGGLLDKLTLLRWHMTAF